MVNSNFLADSSPDPVVAENASDLEQRLGLYQVFLKLYEHHRELLNEILDLENTDRAQIKGVWQYILAGEDADQGYLVTNLLGHTQKLFQPQHCWVIGRDRKIGLPVPDKRLSRRHAMIRYVPQRGFFLSDLESTNGTFLNGEAVRYPTLLKEGDRIRLGSLSFIFFLHTGVQRLAVVPSELLENGDVEAIEKNTQSPVHSIEADLLPAAENGEDLSTSEKDTSLFPQPSVESLPIIESNPPDLSTAQKSDILDRFLNR